jgi:hypothetical protein
MWQAIKNERARAKAMKQMHRLPGSVTPKKRAKTYTQRELDARVAEAVAAKFDALDREIRRLMVEFPKDRSGLERARVATKTIGAQP